MVDNRAERRRRDRAAAKAFTDDNDVVQMLRSTGVEMRLDGPQLDMKYGANPAANAKPGEHVWMVLMMHRVNPDTWFDGEQHIDMESLMNIHGPGCYLCEAVYSAEVAAAPCPGQPPGDLRYV